MGNQPSSEAYRGNPLSSHPSRASRPPPPADRPLPPLPRPLPADELDHALSPRLYSSAHPRTSTLTSAATNKLSKPRNRARSQSTAGVASASTSGPGLTLNTESLAKGPASNTRFSTSSFANLVSSTFSPKTPSSSTFASASAAGKSPNPLKHRPSSSSVSGPAKGSSLQSPSVFTFEEAVAAFSGQQNRESASWKPITGAYDAYPDPSLDLELQQEQQARQKEFEERQRLNLIQRQNRLSRSKTPKLPQEQFLPQQQSLRSQDYRAFDFKLDSAAIENLVSDPTAEFDFEEKPVEREPRKLQRPFQRVWKEPREPKEEKEPKDRLNRRSFFRSSSTQRTARPENGFGDLDAGYTHPRRNSIGSVYAYSSALPGRNTWDSSSNQNLHRNSMTHNLLSQAQDWPPAAAAGTRTSWNYDMSSYAAKRLLHIVDHNDGEKRFEQSSVTSESRRSTLSEVTWKSSHPVPDEKHDPALMNLKRATSDLSLYAPIRRTSMLNIPGVATRRNSTSNFGNMASSTSLRPSFRHSQTAPQAPSTPPSLSRNASFDSLYGHDDGLSMPALKRPTAIFGDAAGESVARVSTPTDNENIRYSTIGAYKLGSLRITNGTASPSSPEPKKPRKVNAEDGSPIRSPDFECKARSMALAALSGNTPVEDHNPYFDFIEPNIKSVPTDQSDITKPKIKLSPSMLQLSLDAFSPDQPVPEPIKTPIEPPQVELPDDLFAGFEFSSFSFEDTVTVEVPAEAVHDQSYQHQQYQLQTTSKATAMEDDLFEEDDRSTLGYSTAEVLDVRLDPSAKPSAKRGRAGILASRKSVHSVMSVTRSDSGFVSSPTSESSHSHSQSHSQSHPHKALSKADSGYSSNVSLRSFKQAASKLMAPVAKAANRLSSDRDSSRAVERESFVIDELKLPSPTFDAADMSAQMLHRGAPSPPARKAPAPPMSTASENGPETPPKDDYPPTPVSISVTNPSSPIVSDAPSPRLVRSSTSPAKMHKKRYVPPAPIDTTRLAASARSDSQTSSRTGSSPSPLPLTPTSIQSRQSVQSARSTQSNGSASALSIGSGIQQRPNKLLRFLSFNNSSTGASHAHAQTQKGPPAVHATHVDDEFDADVPAVPSLVNDQLHEHTGRFPMTTKRLALRSQLSNNTLKTIFSVGSLENRGSNADLRGSSIRDGSSSRAGSRLSMNRDFTADGAKKRKSKLYMAVDFSQDAVEEVEVQEVVETEIKTQPEQTVQETEHRSKTFTSSTLVEARVENKAKASRVSWRRRVKEDVKIQTREQTQTVEANTKAEGDDNDKTRSRSSSIINRTMSMTAQFERTLSMKLSFPRLSKPVGPDNSGQSTQPESTSYSTPAAPPKSSFSTALNDRDQPLSPSLPSPLYAGAMAHRKSMAKDPAERQQTKPPVSARMQQIRPSMLRVPPPLRSKSTPPIEAGSAPASRDSNREMLFSAPSSAAPSIKSPMKSPIDPRWEVKTDHDTSSVPSRRASVDSSSRAYNGPYVPHRSFSGDTSSLFVQFSTQAAQPQVQFYESQDEQPQSRVIRYRASYDGYSSVSASSSGSHENSKTHHAPSMSNGYTDSKSVPRQRSGSSGGDIYTLQQQQAWDYYYQQYARPPSAHSRNRSMGSRHGPMPGPQAPYRILHSYNSPAYRGVPIWG